MNMLESLVLVVHVMIALAICGLVLLQHGKGADMGAAFGSGSSGQPVRGLRLRQFPFPVDRGPGRAVLRLEPRPHVVRDDARPGQEPDAAGHRGKGRLQVVGSAGIARGDPHDARATDPTKAAPAPAPAGSKSGDVPK